MENKKRRDDKNHGELYKRDAQPKKNSEATNYEFEGMNFEQPRENYRMHKSHVSKSNSEGKSNSSEKWNNN
jgi:hypothetical protein